MRPRRSAGLRRRARELCASVWRRPSQLFAALYGLFFFHISAGPSSPPHSGLAERCCASRDRTRTPSFADRPPRRRDRRCSLGGLPGAASTSSGRWPSTIRPAQFAGVPSTSSIRASAPLLLSCALLALGHPARAQTGARGARRRGGWGTRSPRAGALLRRRAPPAARRLGSRREALTSCSVLAEQGFPLWRARARFLRGWALAGRARTGGAWPVASRPRRYAATGSRQFDAVLSGSPGRGAEGRARRRWSLVEEALAWVERTGERWFEAELHRLEGEAAAGSLRPDRAEAEACFCARSGRRPPAGREVVGAARRRASPGWARPGPPRRGARSARPRLRLVHRGLRHAGPAGREGAARRRRREARAGDARAAEATTPLS